jgi:AhpD family alkylhydroperoxidase
LWADSRNCRKDSPSLLRLCTFCGSAHTKLATKGGLHQRCEHRTVAEVIEAEIVKVLSLMGMIRAMLPPDG